MTDKEYKKIYEMLDLSPMGDGTYSYQCPLCNKFIILPHKEVASMILRNKYLLCEECAKANPEYDELIHVTRRRKKKDE